VTVNGTQVKISPFRLDKYEVTVGRFKQFIAAYDDWHKSKGNPKVGAGAAPAGSGWPSNGNGNLPANAAALASGSNQNCLAEEETLQGADLTLPINCVTWYEAYAFCIWDAGRLPTVVEWHYAASAGFDGRTYPWGSTFDPSDSVYGCTGDGSAPNDCAMTDILPVGSRPLGAGLWGHLDLSGSMWEWTLDTSEANNKFPPASPCNDCIATQPTGDFALRGGAWDAGPETSYADSNSAYFGSPSGDFPDWGFRCAGNAP